MPTVPVNLAYISLGSNIRPAHNLPRAVAELRQSGTIAAVSQVWSSRAVGDPDQADFCNGAVLLETELSAVELKRKVFDGIEQQLKRKRDPGNKNAARTVDLDLALFNLEVFQLGDRCIPDPEILERPFVAVPLAEIDPDYLHPVEHKTLQEIADRFDLAEWGMELSQEVQLVQP